ncbi:MAG: beta-lactamase family protein [Deltaproteobacteria bacterium]|nr:beta-lactamase family protein [Deltaproteobacteria bacterium]
MVQGSCDPRFEAVREAFTGNFDEGDLGASCAVTLGGELLVDLWGGHQDLARHVPWERNTIVNVWSTSKMVAALCVLMLHDRNALSIDVPVADFWPEFGTNGKEGLLVRHVLGHTAGLPVFDEPMDDMGTFGYL